MISLISILLSATVSLACAEHEATNQTAHHAHGKKTKLLAGSKLVKGSIPDAGPKSYGQGITLTEAPISLADALARKAELAGKEILVKAKVDTVCQAQGCWLTLKEGKTQVRVTFKDYSFFVPKNSAKSEAVIQGKIFDKEISAAEARHYAKDAGTKPSEVKKITESSKAPWFEATGLTLGSSPNASI